MGRHLFFKLVARVGLTRYINILALFNGLEGINRLRFGQLPTGQWLFDVRLLSLRAK